MNSKIWNNLSVLTAILTILVSSQNLRSQEFPQGKTVSVNGMELYFEIQGQGDPLVLLHGYLVNGEMWKPFIEEFKRHFRLIIPDLRGHGRSNNPNPTEIYSTRQAAKDIIALLDYLDVFKFKAIGASLGALILLHISTQQPERVEAQVLIGGTSYFPDEFRETIRKISVKSYSERTWEYYRNLHKNGDDQIRLLLHQFQKFADSYEDVNFTARLLSRITAKTLIIHGDRDLSFPVTIATQMYQSIPNSYLWVIPNGGHYPIVGRIIPIFSQTAREFLEGDSEKEQ